MSDSSNVEQIAADLEQLDEKSEQQFQDCKIRSALRTAREATRIAKTRGLAVHYMRGLFDQMRFGHGVLEPGIVREASVELIALLEDEENARRLQPDLDEAHYHWICSWMSSCAYDNLAESTGLMLGYNSEGMHDCINDGIQVCRQTGKLECIKCFREYAADVYLAADDLAMVRHQCSALMEYREDGADDKDRRWSAQDKLAWVALLEGRLSKAIESWQTALPLTQEENVYLKTRGKLLVAVALDEALSLAGQPRFNWSEIEAAGLIPEPGEWPKFELERDKAECVARVISGNVEGAIETLTDWDRRLTELSCGKEWFEIRLRLIAAYLLAENRKRAEALAKGLEAKATETQDYLTLRRLQRLMSAKVVSPIPTLQPLDCGPYADTAVPGSMNAEPVTQAEESLDPPVSESEEESEPVTPLSDALNEYMQQIMEAAGDEDQQQVVFEKFLSHEPAAIENPQDAAYLIHLIRFLIRGADMARQAWDWAIQIQQRFADHPKVLSVVADLGHYFHTVDPMEFSDISVETLESWHRLALKLNPDDAKNHARAASFFFAEEQMGEAERCYARAFRLDRTEGSIAQHLADLYLHTDRPRDALAVLDLCLREGSEDANVAWEAAMVSLQLEQFDLVLTYLDRFMELGEETLWLYYYRACAYLQLQRPEACLSELDQEERLEPPGPFHLLAIRTCALIQLGQQAEAKELIKELLAMPVREIDYLSLNGLVRILGQVWDAVALWANDDPSRLAVEQRLLETGLAPDGYFEEIRSQHEPGEAVHFYRVRLLQPLDEAWSDSCACLPGQGAWTEYLIEWGVLASDEEEAVRLASSFQTQCGDDFQIAEVEESEETYRDRPGVVWQGLRWSADADEDHQHDDE